MAVLLAFAPFIIFTIVDGMIGSTAGLFAGAMTSVMLLMHGWLRTRRTPKVQEFAIALLFTGLTLYVVVATPSWSVATVRLLVDGGLLIIVVLSLALGRPFTTQYLNEPVAREAQERRGFLPANLVITWVWSFAFMVMVIGDTILVSAQMPLHRLGSRRRPLLLEVTP